jgi:hypothetical protein
MVPLDDYLDQAEIIARGHNGEQSVNAGRESP